VLELAVEPGGLVSVQAVVAGGLSGAPSWGA